MSLNYSPGGIWHSDLIILQCHDSPVTSHGSPKQCFVGNKAIRLLQEQKQIQPLAPAVCVFPSPSIRASRISLP